MSYSDFTLEAVKKKLYLSIREEINLFATTPKIQPSELLSEILDYNLPFALAINTKKFRSELIIAPILVEIKKVPN